MLGLGVGEVERSRGPGDAELAQRPVGGKVPHSEGERGRDGGLVLDESLAWLRERGGVNGGAS
ncbi:hypothetical protein ADK90_28125 [Streptomyces sp. XY413]|uniref:hypothetical protein n=1 Tax=unclassified Streptomyces TaxID=2593676 RepID=UPI0006B05435|nr:MULTISPECIES: hypothetical protein [unclassified Streptomyces]KOU59195.1 hypothetical protein ADK96_33080 [Streptomyces sp. IGB124]KOV16383.1 hypothetical protein ADK90_28125 [Streptomyces sp. XY413]